MKKFWALSMISLNAVTIWLNVAYFVYLKGGRLHFFRHSGTMFSRSYNDGRFILIDIAILLVNCFVLFFYIISERRKDKMQGLIKKE